MTAPLVTIRDGLRKHPERTSACFALASAVFLVVGVFGPRVQLNPYALRTHTFPNAGAGVLGLLAGLCAAAALAVSFVVRDRLQHRTIRAESGSLIARPFYPVAWLIVSTSVIGFVALAARVAGVKGGLAADQSIDGRLIYRLRALKGMFVVLIQIGSPTGVALLSAALGLICLAGRDRRAAMYAAFGPPAAGALSEYVLKPLIDRTKEGGLAFPSGHTTGAVSVALALMVLMLPGGVLAGKSGRIRAALLALTLVLIVGVPTGLIVAQYHYVTDVLGGFFVAAITMTLFALAVDRVAALNPERPLEERQPSI